MKRKYRKFQKLAIKERIHRHGLTADDRSRTGFYKSKNTPICPRCPMAMRQIDKKRYICMNCGMTFGPKIKKEEMQNIKKTRKTNRELLEENKRRFDKAVYGRL